MSDKLTKEQSKRIHDEAHMLRDKVVAVFEEWLPDMPPEHLYSVMGVLIEGMLDAFTKAFLRMGLPKPFREAVLASLLEDEAKNLQAMIAEAVEEQLTQQAVQEAETEVKH